jgi:hypothetical protein
VLLLFLVVLCGLVVAGSVHRRRRRLARPSENPHEEAAAELAPAERETTGH